MNRSSVVFGIAISVAAIVGACDGRSPTSPNRVAPATQPIYSLTGIVTEPVGVPVEGATVTVAGTIQRHVRFIGTVTGTGTIRVAAGLFRS